MVASSAKREFLRWIEASGHDMDQLDELPMGLLHEMFPDVTPAGAKWDDIRELTRRIQATPDHIRRFRLKGLTHSKGWVTGIPSNPEDAVIYVRMATLITRKPYTLGRIMPNSNYIKGCMLYLIDDWDEFMHRDRRDEALIPFRKLASSYRLYLS